MGFMGSVFGRTGISVENGLSPKYFTLAQRAGYEARWYNPYIVAEVAMSEGNTNDAFSVLANYIGVFGAPKNLKDNGAEAISMTAPVVMEPHPEAVSMTAPVVTEAAAASSGRRMAFIMPSKYEKLEHLPRPTDPRVLLREVPGRGVLVRSYSGWTDLAKERQQLAALLEDIKKDGIFVVPPPPEEGDAAAAGVTGGALGGGWTWCGAQFHPPFTLPFLRKNEIWLTCPLSEEEMKAKLA